MPVSRRVRWSRSYSASSPDRDDARDQVVVPGEHLRGTVERDVAAELERAQAERRRERRIADDRGRVGGGGLEVRHRQHRIRRRLDQDQVGGGGRRAGLVVLDRVDAPRAKVVEELPVTVVGALGERDRPARWQHRQHDACHGPHPGGIEQGAAAVECAERPLDGDDIRLLGAGVGVRARLAGRVVGPGGRAIERRGHGTTLSVGASGPTSGCGRPPGCPAGAIGSHPDGGSRELRDDPCHHRGEAPLARGAERRGRRSGERQGGREAARARQAAGAGARRAPARPGVVRRARPLRSSPRGRVRDARQAPPGRRGRDGVRHRLRAAGVRLLTGFHRLRRLVERGVRREDLQGDGHGREGRLSGRRDQRLRRRPDPGGRRLARRVRRDLLAQRPGLRGRAADLADPGAVRRRRRLLAGHHRLRADGRGDLVHVHHRPRRGEGRHGRGRDPGGARRCRRSRVPLRCRSSGRPRARRR